MRIRGWTVKDVVQGKPWAHPTHPMFVHFPTALYPVALLFHLASEPGTARVLTAIGLAAAAGAIVTGLVDWSGMVKGSTKRRATTRHMWWQLAAQSIALLALAAPDRAAAAVTAVAVLTMIAGNWEGGKLVYRMAMRVGGAREPSPSTERERQRALERGPTPAGRSASSE